MVLPPTEATLRRQQRRLLRLNDQYPSEGPLEEEKQKWKDMASEAASLSLDYLYGKHIANNREEEGKNMFPENFQGGSSSVQIAMTRGSKLGILEENESELPTLSMQNHNSIGIYDDHCTSPTFDSNTLYSNLEEQSNEAVKPVLRERKQRLLKKSKRNPVGGVTKNNNNVVMKDITKEAWMCGCCGKVFSTFEKADAHEIDCIQKVIKKTHQLENTTIIFRDPKNENDEIGPQKSVKGKIVVASGQKQINGILPSTTASRPYTVVEMDMDDSDYERQQPIDNELLQDIGLLDDINEMSPGQRFAKRKPATSLIRDDSRHMRSRSRLIEASPRAQVSFEKFDYYSPGANSLPKKLTRSGGGDILLTKSMKKGLTKTDEALVNTVQRTEPYILTPAERKAEKYLKYLARDKLYYEDMAERASLLKANPRRKYKTDGTRFKDKVQNKFVDAWQLIKEGDAGGSAQEDFYEKKKRKHKNKDGDSDGDVLVHNRQTHYINVVVNHSATVVKTELKRWAGNRWAENPGKVGEGDFEQFRELAHVGIMKLAKMAVMADFTPRNVSVQLSNNLYRLISPVLKRRGVLIDTEIEYRVGPYFVLAVNIKSIDWPKLMKYSKRLVERCFKEWEDNQNRRYNSLNEEGEPECARRAEMSPISYLQNKWMYARSMHGNEFIANFLGLLHHFPKIISVPLCWFLFHWIIPSVITKYILEGVADEIFSYVEGKGMEMAIQVMPPDAQTAFMLAALRDLREGSEKKKEEEKDQTGTSIIGPLLGPAIPADQGPPPPEKDLPDTLEFINFEIDLPVGFQRLRWALLSQKSRFGADVVFAEANTTEIVILKGWTKYGDKIGEPNILEEDIVGTEMEKSYLMPKSPFVKANRVSQLTQIKTYNDYCFCYQERNDTPEVPYGNTFVTWTQVRIVNTGHNTCRMVCSVEIEFPNGPPMISRMIVSGARSGTAEASALLSRCIIKYANEFP